VLIMKLLVSRQLS